MDFAEWRKQEAKRKGKPIAGRTIDVNVTALANVVRWCVTQKWLREFPPTWHWDALAEVPEECELLTEEQIGQLCASAMSVPEIGLLDRRRPRPNLREYLQKLQAARARFSD